MRLSHELVEHYDLLKLRLVELVFTPARFSCDNVTRKSSQESSSRPVGLGTIYFMQNHEIMFEVVKIKWRIRKRTVKRENMDSNIN